MTDECIHGLGPVYACTICNGKDKAAEATNHYRFFPAQWPGQCPGCNLPIRIGQMIAWIPDRRPTHEGCQ